MGEASLIGLCGGFRGSRSSKFILLYDLLLGRVFDDSNSKGESGRIVRFLGTDLVLRMDLPVARWSVSEACHRIFSGSSTMIGGFGSGWDLVLILREARFWI